MRPPLACLLGLAASVLPLCAQSPDLALLKSQVREALAPVLDHAAPADPFTMPSLAALESAASYAIAQLQADGFFQDIDTSTIDTWGRDVQAHAARLETLARAYHTPGQAHFQNADTLAAFLGATTALEGILHDGMPKPGNWWNWEIGLPLEYGPALFLMQDALDPAFLTEAIATLRYMIKEEPSPWSRTGQNLIWVSFTRLYLGLLTEETALIDWAQAQIASTCVITTGEGIQPDFSFHQHGPSLQTGAYGAGLAQDIGVYAYYARGTEWALTGEELQVWLDYLTHASRWAIYRNYYEPSTRGRAIVRHDTLGDDSALRALLYGASLESDPEKPLAQSALHTLETWTKALQPGDVAIAADVLDGAAEAAGPVGLRMYPRSDYIVQRGEDWLLSVKMLSDRTLAAERYNDEGKQSRHLSSGVHWLILEGDEWDENGVRPSLDWARLPGATTEVGLNLSRGYPNGNCYGLRSFVGGLAEDGFGLAAMDWKARQDNGDSDLVAKKSWFFWPGGMVALGSDITGRKGWPVQTTAMQWPMSGESATILLNGSPVAVPQWEHSLSSPLWISADSVSYHIPGGQQVRVGRQEQSGRFIDITRSGTTEHTNAFLNIGFDHGTDPASAGYAYAILPRHAQSEGDPPYEIIRHDAAVHAVRFTETGSFAAAFWEAGHAGPFMATSPLLLTDRLLADNQHRILVTDPTQADRTVDLLVAGYLQLTGALPGISVVPAASGGIPLQRLRIPVADGLPTVLDMTVYGAVDVASLPPLLHAIRISRTSGGSFLHLEFTRPVDAGFLQSPGCLEIFPFVKILAVSVSGDRRSASVEVAGLLADIPYQLIVHGLPAEGESPHGESHWRDFQTEFPEVENSLEAIADAYIRDGQYADQNFGRQATLTVKRDGSGYARDTFLKFDLAGLSEPLRSAYLDLTVGSSGGTSGMQHQVYETATAWEETALTWNTAPAPGNLVTVFEAPLEGEAVQVDLTEWVNASLGQVISLRIRAAENYGSEGWLHYASRESSTIHAHPRLLLNSAGTPFGRWIEALVPLPQTDAAADPDLDGLSNRLEFALGLDPATFDVPFAWDHLNAIPANGVSIPIGYPTGENLRIEVSPDLLNWSTPPLLLEDIREGKPVKRYDFRKAEPEFLRVRLEKP